MQEGLIVYLVSQVQGFLSVEDAWHYLVTYGVGSVSLLVACGLAAPKDIYIPARSAFLLLDENLREPSSAEGH